MAAYELDYGMNHSTKHIWNATSEGVYWTEVPLGSIWDEVYIDWDWHSDNFYSGWVNSSLLEDCPSNWIVA